MAARKKPDIENNADLVQDLDQFRRPQPEARLEPRKGRSKRGVLREDPGTSNICFRTQKDNHRALKAYCAVHDKEVGEVMDELLVRFLRSVPQ